MSAMISSALPIRAACGFTPVGNLDAKAQGDGWRRFSTDGAAGAGRERNARGIVSGAGAGRMSDNRGRQVVSADAMLLAAAGMPVAGEGCR